LKEELREIFVELITLEDATKNGMKQIVLEAVMCIEEEIVREEWEIVVVKYVEGKCNVPINYQL